MGFNGGVTHHALQLLLNDPAFRDLDMSIRRFSDVKEAESRLGEGKQLVVSFHTSEKLMYALQFFFQHGGRVYSKAEAAKVLRNPSFERQYPRASSTETSGHAVVAIGWHAKGYLKFKNSWGQNHADDGFFRAYPDALGKVSFLELVHDAPFPCNPSSRSACRCADGAGNYAGGKFKCDNCGRSASCPAAEHKCPNYDLCSSCSCPCEEGTGQYRSKSYVCNGCRQAFKGKAKTHTCPNYDLCETCSCPCRGTGQYASKTFGCDRCIQGKAKTHSCPSFDLCERCSG
eukprot:TRINITY_DN20320_c0_g1_i1.p1 TRINITY_DN20320_c0_g1~~TRINITY_DN20320_c0_g1_i1.p1  ORF type:complete len:309 (+),score=45.58 TRINITY_DN20320_c0_g1_i1:67-927(+)